MISKQGCVAMVVDLLKLVGIASLIKHKQNSFPLVEAFVKTQRLNTVASIGRSNLRSESDLLFSRSE